MQKHASGPWYYFLFPSRITIGDIKIYRWLNFYYRFKDNDKEFFIVKIYNKILTKFRCKLTKIRR